MVSTLFQGGNSYPENVNGCKHLTSYFKVNVNALNMYVMVKVYHSVCDVYFCPSIVTLLLNLLVSPYLDIACLLLPVCLCQCHSNKPQRWPCQGQSQLILQVLQAEAWEPHDQLNHPLTGVYLFLTSTSWCNSFYKTLNGGSPIHQGHQCLAGHYLLQIQI